MKTPVKYGIYLSVVVIAFKLAMSLSGIEPQFQSPELLLMFLMIVGGLILSVNATQKKDYKNAGLPMELLRAGLVTSAVFSVIFATFSTGVVVTTNQKGAPISIGQLLFGFIILFIFILILGGMVSVVISYLISKRKIG
ncbi:MAG TPA: hypothetical protein VGO45_07585 [Bacteroidia bacterium]|jgi:cytochrome bd-type quinol oxidase subunit 2|nr:hypothetical protein [Bacteroidia bacterium]